MKSRLHTILLLCLLTLSCALWGSEPLRQLISFDFDDEPLRLALQQLSEKHQLNFIFSDTLVDQVTITCKAVNESPYAALTRLLLPHRFSPEFIDRNTIIIRRAAKGAKPKRMINGCVRDAETDSPLMSANAYIQGKSIGSATDLNGRFAFAIPDSTLQLIVSYMGYKTEVRQIDSQSNLLDIKLRPLPVELESIQITASPVRGEIEQISRMQLNEENFIGVVPDIPSEMTYASFMDYNDNEVYFNNNDESFFIKITGNRLHPMLSPDRHNRLAFRQHQVKLNGFNLQMPFHTTVVPAMNAGIVDYGLIQKSTYQTTAFDVEYVDAFESVVDLHYRRGNSTVSGKAMLDLSTSSFMLEGPLTSHASWMINGKKSHINDLLNTIHKNKWMSLGFHDLQGQLDFQPAAQHNLRINYIHSVDQMSLAPQINSIRERAMFTSSLSGEIRATRAEEHIREINSDNDRFRLNAISGYVMSQISEQWKSEFTVSYAAQYYRNKWAWSVEHDTQLPEVTDSSYNYLWSEGKEPRFCVKSAECLLIGGFDVKLLYGL